MTPRALAGLIELNLLIVAIGAGLLLTMRGRIAFRDLVRLLGLGYLLAVAALGFVVSAALVVGVEPTRRFVVVFAILSALAAAIRVRRSSSPEVKVDERRREPLPILGLAVAALAAVYLGALLQAAWQRGLTGWDAWAFWTPKAQAIYYFGGLDEQLFRMLAGATYPLLVPEVQALAFEFMGSANTVAVHVQIWALLVGFVGAVAGLLRPQVPHILIWPFLTLLLLTPEASYRLLFPGGDFTLQYLFVTAALSLILWLRRSEWWLLACAAILAAGAMATKREGQLFVAALFVVALAATLKERRRLWPWLLLAGLAAFATTLPWRIWFTSRHLAGEGTGSGLAELADTARDRAWPSLRLVVSALFDYDQWLAAPTVGALALALAAVFGNRRSAATVAALSAVLIAGLTWILWGVASLPLVSGDPTPIPRAVGVIVILLVASAPLLLSDVLERSDRLPTLLPAGVRRAADWNIPFGAALALVPAAIVALVGVSRGDFAFAQQSCGGPPVEGQPVDIVFGRPGSWRRGMALQQKIEKVGFTGTHLELDDCGGLKLVLASLPSLEVAREIQAEARAVEIPVSIERG